MGIQYQIRYNHQDNVNYVGELRGKFNRDWYSKDGIFGLPSNGGVAHATQNGMNKQAADALAHGLDGQGNKCKIIVMGNEYIIYKLNVKVANMVTDLSWSSGHIGLEAETGEILWRNIEVKEFKKSVPMKEFLKK